MRTIGNYLFFYGGKDGIYSNWYRTSFRDPVTGLVFKTTEQAWMWYKASFFGDFLTLHALEVEMHPKDAKALGRKVNGFNATAWDCVGFGFMVYVNYLKYSQNEDLKQQLLATGDLTLVEASPYDKIWGIGLGLDEEDYILADPNNWDGKNLLGKALVEVRSKLLNKV